MKAMIKLVCSGIAATMLVACDGGPDAASQENSTKALESQVIEVASQINRAASAAVDPDTRLDGAKAGPGLKLVINYTLVNPAASGVDSTDFAAKQAPTVIKGGCENSALRQLIDQGVAVTLQYKDLKGSALGTATLNRDVCNALR